MAGTRFLQPVSVGPHRYLTAAEAAAKLRFETADGEPNLKAFYQFLTRHAVPICRRGRVLLFDEAELDAWLRDNSRALPDVTTMRRRRVGER